MTTSCVPAETLKYFTLGRGSACLLADEGLGATFPQQKKSCGGFVVVVLVFFPSKSCTTRPDDKIEMPRLKRQEWWLKEANYSECQGHFERDGVASRVLLPVWVKAFQAGKGER